MKNSLALVIDYIHNIYSCQKHRDYEDVSILPTVTPIKFEGYYLKKAEKIDKILSLNTKEIIIQIVNVNSLNLLEIKKILRQSYSTIYQHIKDLENLKIIELKKGIGKQGKRDLKVMLHKDVEIIPISELKERFENELIKSENEKIFFKKELIKEIDKINKIKTIRFSQPNKKIKKR